MTETPPYSTFCVTARVVVVVLLLGGCEVVGDGCEVVGDGWLPAGDDEHPAIEQPRATARARPSTRRITDSFVHSPIGQLGHIGS